jgi:glutaminyl-peptide cyclotransferase
MLVFWARKHAALTGAAAFLLALAGVAGAVDVVSPEIVAVLPHDDQAFTQGLLLHDGSFYESTGLVGRSTLRQVTPATGVVVRSVPLPATEFGEGLALVGDRLLQLTWQDGVAHEYRLSDFSEIQQFEYEGEGWGLCFDGQRLVMSDGSSELFFRDPTTFELLGSVTVTLDGEAIDRLNELSCVAELVYANVWQTDQILRLDPNTGQVATLIDASGLLTSEQARAADVLNGVAFARDTGHFFITGKLWPSMFEVRFPFEPGSLQTRTGESGGDASAVADGSASSTDRPIVAQHSMLRRAESSGCSTARVPVRTNPLGWLGVLLSCSLWIGRRRCVFSVVHFNGSHFRT